MQSYLVSFMGGVFAEEYYSEVFLAGKLGKHLYYEVSESAMMAAIMKAHFMILVAAIDNSFQQGLEDLMSNRRNILHKKAKRRISTCLLKSIDINDHNK